jgi:hypothetical protein
VIRYDHQDWCRRLILRPNDDAAAIPPWLVQAWDDFRENLGDPRYPCFFGGQAYQANAIHHSFVAASDSRHLPQTLRHFLHACRDHPLANLAVFFEPSDDTHAESFARFWSILQMLQDADADGGCSAGAMDPDTPLWEFTFAGVQMFVVGFSPTYRNRRSRSLGQCMIMLFQPRSVFEASGVSTEATDRARTVIRERLRRWDGIPHHPALGVYGDSGSREWQQYFLPDDDEAPLGTCPLRGTVTGAELQRSDQDADAR